MDLLTVGARQHGTTVVLVTHDARVAAYADTGHLATARSARSPGRSRDRTRAAAGDQRRPPGDHPAGHPDDRSRPRRGPAVPPWRRPTRPSPGTTATPGSGPARSPCPRHLSLALGPTSTRCGRTPGDLSAGGQIERFDVAATGTSSPVSRHPQRPGAGNVLRFARADRAHARRPGERLADCYPGHPAGPIGDAALPSPSSLSIVGRTPAQLAQTPNTVQVTSIADAMPPSRTIFGTGYPSTPNPQGLAFYPTDSGAQLHRPHPVRRGAGHPYPGADLHRHRDPSAPPAGRNGSRRCASQAPPASRFR